MAPLGRRHIRGALFHPGPADGKSHDTLVPAMYASFITTCVLSTLVVALRLYVRTRVISGTGKDDWLIILSVIFLWAMAGMGVWGGQIGMGWHIKDVPKDRIRNIYEVGAVLQIFYNLSVFSLQLGILSLYHRLTISRTLHRVLYVVAFIATLFAGARIYFMARLTFGQHSPIVRDYSIIWYLGSASGIAIDFLIWLLPIPVLCSIRTGASTNMTRRRKVGLIISFGIGLTACVLCVFKLLNAYITMSSPEDDIGWDGAEVTIFEVFELCLGICSACVPMLRALFRRASLHGREVDMPQMQRAAQIDEIYSPIVENANGNTENTLDGLAHQKANPWIGGQRVGEEGIFELGQVAVTITTPDMSKRDTKEVDLQNSDHTAIPRVLDISAMQMQHPKIHPINPAHPNAGPTEQSATTTLPASPPSAHHAQRPSISSIRRASSRLSDRMIMHMATTSRPYNEIVGDSHSEIKC
ncbi:hypothetical protein DFH27DRAFT_524993 [Peziza echinospora]|nr:hypothetical protein DFH27DRAFT_524993 [Peziza echinospora]